MRDNYRVFVNNDGKFSLVDMRDNPDVSGYIAQTTSSWKKIATAGQRRYYSTNHDFFQRGGTYILSYGRGPVAVVNPAKGDYIPPGYDRVSRELGELFRGWDGIRCVARCRLIPMPGQKVINRNLNCRQNRFCVYRNQPQKDYMVGWTLFHNSTRTYYCYIESNGAGIKCQHEDDIAMMTQTLTKEIFEGSTRIHIRVHGDRIGNDSPTRLVMLDETPFVRQDDGSWVWEGEPITEDKMLTIQINGSYRISSVEFLDD